MQRINLRSMNATREHLLNTAERLFLENGPDDVSLRTIVQTAGQKNQSALQYHFGGREGLLKALLNRRLVQIESRRQALMEKALAQQPDPELREVCALMAQPVFLLCREHADFSEFLAQFGLQLLANEPTLRFDFSAEDLPSLKILQALVRRQLQHLEPALLTLRVENAQGMALLAFSRRARHRGSFRGKAAELFFNNLIDQIAAMLAAPVSETTQSLID